jgi:GNAT superfamily N-acetyltransferase
VKLWEPLDPEPMIQISPGALDYSGDSRHLQPLGCAAVTTIYQWRGMFTNGEVNALHAEAFNTRLFSEAEWNWVQLVEQHSLGWVVARQGQQLVGFVNVVWDGLVHAWLQDTMVAAQARGKGIGTKLVAHARDGAKAAGCEYLHVDFDDHLRPFYLGACGFVPTSAGLLSLD